MEVINILQAPELLKISVGYEQAKHQQQLNSWNIFTLSAEKNHLENFHSDILASLLKTDGPHGHNSQLLLAFVDFLTKHHGVKIDKDIYRNAIVVREEGRLDLWIKGDNHCIIIENKINNALDGEKQILNYHSHASNSHTVDAVIYLSLDGLKKAPYSTAHVDAVTYNIAAINNTAGDLVNGWLRPYAENTADNNVSSFLIQYVKLLTHINNQSMEQTTKQDFYQYISNKSNLAIFKNALELYNSLNTYRRDIFFEKIDNWRPFERAFRLPSYGNCAVVFEFYYGCADRIKMDVFFTNEGAWIRLWACDNDNEIGLMSVLQTLNKTALNEDFERERPHEPSSMMITTFQLKDYESIESLDTAVVSYVKDICTKLCKLQEVN